ncbi:MAG: STAS domain-containing protein [Planctomycetes bacterium]|nr:STAS domain-containing protein [Planctomycetota bacterium]
MSADLGQDFRIERHGEIAVVTPSAKVEEMHETLIEQAARMVVQALREDPPAGIVVDLSQVNYFGSVFVSFLLRCHALAKKNGTEIVLAGASDPARELLHLLDLETLWALYTNRQEAIEALSSD